MSNVSTSEVKPALPVEKIKIKVKVDGREVAGATSNMKFAASPQH
jgi:hypothetical protein